MTPQTPPSSAPRKKWTLPWWALIAIMAAIIVTPLVLAGYTLLHLHG